MLRCSPAVISRICQAVLVFGAAWLSVAAPGPGMTPSAGIPASAPASVPATPVAHPTEAQIREAVRQLNHPIPARRRAAIRQLAEWGPVAFPELRRVARSGRFEAALSARDLLAELESAILIGAQVQLEVDRGRVAWNEPFTVFVHALNPTGEKIEVPWPAGGDKAATQPAEQDARQVGALLDAGDFLVVTGPDGEAVEPRIEPIERDPAVYETVNVRARGTPPSHPVPAGQADRLAIPQFNRGWARYPMLSAGRYTIRFSYQPQWKDPSWTKERFGLVESEPIVVEVTQGAPEAIRNADAPLRLHIKAEGGSMTAELESLWDRELWVNLNLGEDLTTRSQLQWQMRRKQGGDGEEEPVRWSPEPTGERFRPELVRAVKPGDRLVIGQVPIATLREALRAAVQNPPAKVGVSVRYTSIATPTKIREDMGERRQAGEVPTQLYSGTLSSEGMTINP